MAQTLTVHRVDQEWIARDVTGSSYGNSTDLFQTSEAAERLAKRIGATVSLSRDAQNHILTLGSRKRIGYDAVIDLHGAAPQATSERKATALSRRRSAPKNARASSADRLLCQGLVNTLAAFGGASGGASI